MSSALIAPDAQIGRNVEIGHCTRIYPGVVVGDDTKIGDFCVLGHPARSPWGEKPLFIGAGSTIRSHSVLYRGSELGPRLETGHHVVIREGTVAGENLRVGNFSDIEGDCTLGDFVRCHGYVHVGRGSTIGHFVWLFSLTTGTNDPLPPSHAHRPVTVGDGSVVCVGATLMPGTVLGKGVFVSAGARTHGEVPNGAVISGEHGEIVNHVSRLIHLETGTRHPWMRHFADAYPASAQQRLQQLLAEIMANRLTLQTTGR